MSDLYRLYDDDKDGDGKLGEYLLVVPDTRLQAIADAWAEGNTEPISAGIRVARKSVRDWWPEVATLLDALDGTDE